ncbi:SpaH/EbpB family LPXTG-anchored major pilin [Vagococcus fluvialis]|uniref:SpaH/EbpB family LPXTG-anchored major pilin n=1 Tax=Vagococcus fluvialis TaxID=2738 RepID=UPI003B223D1E
MNKKIFKLVSVLALMLPLLASMFTTNTYAAPKDDDKTAINVHLHKLVFDKGTKPSIENTGQEMQDLGGDPLTGVTFTVFDVTDKYVAQLAVDPSAEKATSAIVNEASNAIFDKAANNLAGFGTAVSSVVTNENGIATFANLPIKNGDNYATYLFVETNSPAEISERATPIVLSMPIYVPDTNDINPDVVVYPKNEKDTMIEKDLTEEAKKDLAVTIGGKDFNAEIGKPFGYSIFALVPWNIADKEYYKITDTPDAGMKVLVNTVGIAGLEKGTDFTVTANGNGYILELNINSDKVKALAGNKFEIKYDAFLTDDVTIDFGINNSATVELGTTNNPDTPDKPTVTGPEVFTGGKKFKKVDDRSGKTLANAEFKLVKLDTNGKIIAYAHYDEDKGEYTWNENEESTIYKSEANGLFEIKGLEYSAKLKDGVTYALVETKAPTGYAVLNKPVKFEVVKGEFNTQTLDVENIKKGILPSTGGNGIYMFLVAGSLLMIGAFVWYRRTQVETEV